MSTTETREPPIVKSEELENRREMAIKALRWLFFTVLFSYVPLGAKLLFSFLFRIPIGFNDLIGEILFASIVISAETLHVLYGSRKKSVHNRGSEEFMLFSFVFSIIVILLAAMLYGVLLILNGSSSDLQLRIDTEALLIFTTFLGVGSLLIGLSLQFLARKNGLIP